MNTESNNETARRGSARVTRRGGGGVTRVCAMMRSMGRKGPNQPLSPEAVKLVAARFRILGEPLRIHILQILQAGERNVSELVAAVGSTQPNVSKHLRILQEAGIVGRRQQGNNVICYIADPSVLDLCDAVCGSVGDRLEQTAKLAAELSRGVRRR